MIYLIENLINNNQYKNVLFYHYLLIEGFLIIKFFIKLKSFFLLNIEI